MDERRLLDQVLYSQWLDALRKAGGQKLRFKDTLRHNLQIVGIDHKNWEMIACDHSRWKKNMRLGLYRCEKARMDKIEQKRLMHDNYTSEDLTGTKNICNICHRVCLSRIGLLHMNMLKDKW